MEKRIDEIKKKLSDVEGFFGEQEGEFLYRNLVALNPKNCVLEIGSWKGKSTIWLASASKDSTGVEVFAVDPHTGSPEHHKMFGEVDTYSEFKQNINNAGVDDVVCPIRKTSEAAAQEWDGRPISFLWIDGAHEYEMVKKDFDLWSPYLVEGGIVAFHDTGLRKGTQGPKEFVEKYIFTSNQFKDVKFFETITMAKKVSKNTVIDRMVNRFTLYKKRTFQRLRKILKSVPAPKGLRKIVSKLSMPIK